MDEPIAKADGFYYEFGAVRDLLTSADYAARVLENSSRQSAESRQKGIEYLRSILVDAIAKCESAASIEVSEED